MTLVGIKNLDVLSIYHEGIHQSVLYPEEDVKLKIQNTIIPCNRSILSAQSPFFEAMFSLPFKEQNSDVVEINGEEIDVNTMQELIHFMYEGSLHIRWVDLPTIIQACAFLQMTQVLEICDRYLTNEYLDKNNCILCFCFAKKYNLQELMETSRQCIVRNFMDLISHSDFSKMDETQLVTIIRDDRLHVPNEDVVLDAILQWVNCNVEQRHQHFAKLLASFVRFPYCTPEYLERRRNELSSCEEFFDNSFPPRKSFEKLIIIGTNHIDGPIEISYNDHFHSVWTDLTDLPDHRLSNFSACSTPNGIIITGGMRNPKNICGESYLFDFKQWRNLPPLICPRYHHKALFHDNAVYVIGGLDSNHRKLAAVEKYDHTEQWTEVSPMETRIFRPVVASFDGAIFLFSFSELFKYNSKTDEWEAKKQGVPHENLSPLLCDAVPFKNKIYVIGTSDMWGETFWAYQPASDQWEILSSPTLMHLHASAFVWQGKIMVGGGTQTDEIEMYDIETKQWSRWDLSLPRQDWFQKMQYQIFCNDF